MEEKRNIFLLFHLCLFEVIQNIAGQNVQITVIKPLVNDSCGIKTGGPLIQQLSSTVSYAGALFWADNGNKIVYTDRFGSAMGRYEPVDGKFYRGLLSLAKEYTCVFPVKNATDLRFVVGQDRRLLLNTIVTTGGPQEAQLQDLLTITNNKHESIFVGKTDSVGRAWFSSGNDKGLRIGKLYKIDNLQKPVVMVEHLRGGAGMAWSHDDKYFYLVDSFECVIYQYNFHKEEGTLSNRTTVFELSEHEDLDGFPSDIEVDNIGNLWIAMLGGSSIIQYNVKTREILWQIPIPAYDTVSLAFGNRDRKTLYVGTSKHFLENKKDQFAAGAIFGISGLGVTGGIHEEIVVPEQYRSN